MTTNTRKAYRDTEQRMADAQEARGERGVAARREKLVAEGNGGAA